MVQEIGSHWQCSYLLHRLFLYQISILLEHFHYLAFKVRLHQEDEALSLQSELADGRVGEDDVLQLLVVGRNLKQGVFLLWCLHRLASLLDVLEELDPVVGQVLGRDVFLEEVNLAVDVL